MLVACNGMPRSGSTWSFNVALQLMRSMGAGDVYGGYDESLYSFFDKLPEDARHAVVKCHTLDMVGIGLAQVRAITVIYTWRNLADAAASFMLMFGVGFDHAIAVLEHSLDLYHFHRRNGALILSYEDLTQRAEESVERVAAHIGATASASLIREIAEGTSLGKMRERVVEIAAPEYAPRLIEHEQTFYDPETLLNLNHIRHGGSGYGASRLEESQLERLRDLVRRKGVTDEWLA
jgi:hypothetical protein